jgi:predicted RNA-binding protein YlqC (UPF0109 family)
MSEIDQQFIEYVVKSLVGKPDAVKIDRRIDEKGVLLELTVDPEDLGRVIGKRGATAQSLRTLLRALGTKNDARYNLKIIDNGTGAPSQARDNKSDDQSDDSPAKKSSDDTAAEETATVDDEPVTETAAQPADEEKPIEEEDQTSDRLKKAREELADLDDLDV